MSLLSESLCLLDGKQEFLSELLQASVGRQIQTIEAVRTRHRRRQAGHNESFFFVYAQIHKHPDGIVFIPSEYLKSEMSL